MKLHSNWFKCQLIEKHSAGCSYRHVFHGLITGKSPKELCPDSIGRSISNSQLFCGPPQKLHSLMRKRQLYHRRLGPGPSKGLQN